MNKHIPKNEIINYIGKKVWFDIRSTRFDISNNAWKKEVDFLKLGEAQIVDIDEENGIIKYKNGFFDYISRYEVGYVYWEEKPTCTERESDDWFKM